MRPMFEIRRSKEGKGHTFELAETQSFIARPPIRRVPGTHWRDLPLARAALLLTER